MRELKDIFIKAFNIGGEISQQPSLRVIFVKSLRRISTLFPSNEVISEVLKAPTIIFFKPLRRIFTLFPSNEVIFEVLEVEDSVSRY